MWYELVLEELLAYRSSDWHDVQLFLDSLKFLRHVPTKT